MNTSILKKCLDELKKETPNLSYIMGILETFIEMNDKSLNNNDQLGAVVPGKIINNINETIPKEKEEYNPMSRVGPIAKLN